MSGTPHPDFDRAPERRRWSGHLRAKKNGKAAADDVGEAAQLWKERNGAA